MSPLIVLLALAIAPAAAQPPPAPRLAAVRSCLDAAGGATEAERACAGVAPAACIDAYPEGETTVAMTGCAMAETAAWGADAPDAARAGAIPQEDLLRAAQRAWVAFRSADCAQEAAYWGDGSMRQIAGSQCVLDRTATRTVELRAKRRVFEAR